MQQQQTEDGTSGLCMYSSHWDIIDWTTQAGSQAGSQAAGQAETDVLCRPCLFDGFYMIPPVPLPTPTPPPL